MQVPFRQGIVKSVPNFLQLTGSNVSIVVPQPDYVLVTISHGTTDYLMAERGSVTSAWAGPFTSGSDYWLYWDMHPLTGAKTYGHTLYEPVEGSIAPISPAGDQHWFDTSSNKMKVWNASAGRWIEKIRVFAARLTGSSLFISMSINSPDFEGTQVGSYVNTPVLSGYLVYDTEGRALRKGNGTFFTTEDVGITGITSSSRVRLGGIVKEAESIANMANNTIVVFTDFDKVGPANPTDFIQTKQFGIIEEDVVIGDFVNVITEGAVSSIDWDWSPYGVNTPLYVSSGGVLSVNPTAPALSPIAIVTGKNSIQLGTLKVTVNTTGTTVVPMTTSIQGTGKLSVAAANLSDPIVCGDNDPRLVDARYPTPHGHAISDVTGLQTDLNGKAPTVHSHAISDVTGLQTDLNGRVLISGDTMTGPLILAADPVTLLQAATKQYVDNNAGGAISPGTPHQTLTTSAAGEVVWNNRTELVTLSTLIDDPTKESYLIDFTASSETLLVLDVGPNLFDGQRICAVIKQNNAGTGTIDFGSSIVFPRGLAPSMPTTVGSYLVVQGIVVDGVLHADGKAKDIPPVVGSRSGLVGESIDTIVCQGLLQPGNTGVIGVSSYEETPVVTLCVPVEFTGVSPYGLGFSVVHSVPSTTPSSWNTPLWYISFRSGQSVADVFINPFESSIQANPVGSGIPIGQHTFDYPGVFDSNNDYLKVSVMLPSGTPPAVIIDLSSISNSGARLTPASLTGLDPNISHFISITTYDLSSALETITIEVPNTANKSTIADLINSINLAFEDLQYSYSAPQTNIRCAWSFNGSVAFVAESTTCKTMTFTSPDGLGPWEDISTYYMGGPWYISLTEIPGWGQTSFDPYGTNTNSTVAGLTFIIPVIPSDLLSLGGGGY